MKFYYNGKLVRTSKTHNYNYALIWFKDNGELVTIACSEKLEVIEARKAESIKMNYKQGLEYMLDCNAKKYQHNELYRRTFTEAEIEQERKDLEKYKNELKIVKLEKVA